MATSRLQDPTAFEVRFTGSVEINERDYAALNDNDQFMVIVVGSLTGETTTVNRRTGDVKWAGKFAIADGGCVLDPELRDQIYAEAGIVRPDDPMFHPDTFEPTYELGDSLALPTGDVQVEAAVVEAEVVTVAEEPVYTPPATPVRPPTQNANAALQAFLYGDDR